MLSRLQRFWLGMRLFLGNYTSNGEREPKPQRLTIANGAQLELYKPNKQVRKSVLLISGVSILGEEEPRLIRLARSLNATGVRVAVVVLPGLKSLRFEKNDLDTARDCLRYVLKQYGHPANMVAFSAGGSIALTLSTEPEFAAHLKLVALFSPIYDPHETLKIVETIARTPITDPENADNEIWIHMVNAYRNAETLGFTQVEKSSIKLMLQRYMLGFSTAEKIAFHQNIIARRPMNGYTQLDENAALSAVSPVGKLKDSTARVIIIHDAHDFVVPVMHMQALEHELNQRRPPDNRILITPALSHVNLRPKYILDILQMIDMIGELYT
jgi:pimeloyl-ACP methyl ester carboxylesterase